MLNHKQQPQMIKHTILKFIFLFDLAQFHWVVVYTQTPSQQDTWHTDSPSPAGLEESCDHQAEDLLQYLTIPGRVYTLQQQHSAASLSWLDPWVKLKSQNHSGEPASCFLSYFKSYSGIVNIYTEVLVQVWRSVSRLWVSMFGERYLVSGLFCIFYYIGLSRKKALERETALR